MRILMLTSSYPKYPGETTAPFIEEIAASLAVRGHAVHVVAPYHPDIRRDPIDRGVQLHFYRYAPHPALNIWGYAQSLESDTAIKGATVAATPFALAGSAKGLLDVMGYTPRVTYHPQQRFDIVHTHWVIPNGPPALFAAWWKNFPLVVSLHGNDVHLAENYWPMTLSAAVTLQSAVAVTACSTDLAMRGMRLGAHADKSRIIHYGVNPDEFTPDPAAGVQVREELNVPATTPLVLAMGRLVAKKGFDVLLDSWPHVLKQHPDAMLVIGGYGDLRGALEQQAAKLDIAANVRFTGQLERQHAATYLAAATVFTLPIVQDQGTDGLPNVLLEAMATGCPLVASRVAGVPDVIEHERHGLLVEEREPKELATAISRLLSKPELARSLGAAARARIEAELTWDHTAEHFERVYDYVIRKTTTG